MVVEMIDQIRPNNRMMDISTNHFRFLMLIRSLLLFSKRLPWSCTEDRSAPDRSCVSFKINFKTAEIPWVLASCCATTDVDPPIHAMADPPERQLQQPEILRVRRHRTVDSVDTLRVAPQLDVLLNHWGLSDATTSSAVYYERVDEKKKRRRKGEIFHAQLLDEENEQRITKRRKLQLLDNPATTILAIHEYATLTPEQNKVNESLLMVFQGTRRLSEHCDILQTSFDNDWMAWLDWCSPSGTWLHAASLWNEDSLVKHLLLKMTLSDDILHTLDEEGHSALEIAKLSCHEEMIVLLEQLEQESEFVYDVYEFRRPESIDTTMADDGLNILDCELLRHNAGYNPGGLAEDSELLEPTGQSEDDDDEEDKDSNDEDWFANDYPEEESSSEEGRFQDYDYDDGEYDPAYGNMYGQ